MKGIREIRGGLRRIIPALALKAPMTPHLIRHKLGVISLRSKASMLDTQTSSQNQSHPEPKHSYSPPIIRTRKQHPDRFPVRYSKVLQQQEQMRQELRAQLA